MLATKKRNGIDALVTAHAAACLRDFVHDVSKTLGPRLSQIVLFGSRARGDSHGSSDYDVAVFVRDIEDRRALDHLLSDLAYRHVLDGVHIRPVALAAGFLEKPSESALAASIIRDGVALR